jgi:hypothetical protein
MPGLGKLKECYLQGIFSDKYNNMTLGIHAQEYLSTRDIYGKVHRINTLYIGFYFFRIVFEFVI